MIALLKRRFSSVFRDWSSSTIASAGKPRRTRYAAIAAASETRSSPPLPPETISAGRAPSGARLASRSQTACPRSSRLASIGGTVPSLRSPCPSTITKSAAPWRAIRPYTNA